MTADHLPHHLDLGAIILAGGRGSRLGGADKAALLLDGQRLVDRVAEAARGVGAQQLVIAGPAHTQVPHSTVVREDPPFSGPLAGLAVALPHLDAEWTLLLSCDLEHPSAVCARLHRAVTAHSPGQPHRPDHLEHLDHPDQLDGFVLCDAEGRTQWLAGIYRTAVLHRGIADLDGAVANRPLRAVVASDRLRLQLVDAGNQDTADLDTVEDLHRAGINHPNRPNHPASSTDEERR